MTKNETIILEILQKADSNCNLNPFAIAIMLEDGMLTQETKLDYYLAAYKINECLESGFVDKSDFVINFKDKNYGNKIYELLSAQL